ncbi:hypothetical protein [Halopseudomonas pelagia]|uniref:hypothetical protein n=1 Tax=Halopseudomonas pelagia TaxID=553151 RepID=UPI0030DAA5D4
MIQTVFDQQNRLPRELMLMNAFRPPALNVEYVTIVVFVIYQVNAFIQTFGSGFNRRSPAAETGEEKEIARPDAAT